MPQAILEVKKFRCIYRYSYDIDNLYFYWKKGKKVVNEKYPLKELSSLLGYWKGYPVSTKNNLKKAALLTVFGVSVFWFAIYPWMLFLGFFLIAMALEAISNEIGFLRPTENTVLSYRDGSECLYIPRENSKETQRLEFELGLKEAIENCAN